MNNHTFSKNEAIIREKIKLVKAIIFDVDGVLVRSTDETGRFLWSQTVEQDLGLNNEHLKKIFISQDWLNVIRGHLDTKDHLNKVFGDLNLDLTSDTFIDYWLSRDNNIDPDIMNLVKSLSAYNIPLYVATNQDKYRTSQLKKILLSDFNGIFASCFMGAMKPEPAFFIQIQNALRLPPEDILLIDDTLNNIAEAQRQGWQVHHYA